MGGAADTAARAMGTVTCSAEAQEAFIAQLAATECGRRIAAADWTDTSLGRVHAWSPALRQAVVQMLGSPLPQRLYWDESAPRLYNDAYIRCHGEVGPIAQAAPAERPIPVLAMLHGHGQPGAPTMVAGSVFSPMFDAIAGRIAGVLETCLPPSLALLHTDAAGTRLPGLPELAESAVVGRWDWSPQLDRVVANGRMADLFGLPRDALAAGLPSQALMRRIHAADQPRVARATMRSLERLGEFSEEYRLILADGSVRWVFGQGRCIADAAGHAARLSGIALDVTERKQAEDALRRSQMELRLITDSMPVLIGAFDREERFDFANRTYHDWFGLAPEQVRGRTVRELLGEAGYAVRREAVQRALAGETVAFDATAPHRDGTVHEAHLRYIPRRGIDGEITGAYVMVFDLANTRRAEAALRESEQRLMLVMDTAELGAFEYRWPADELIWDTRCKALFGLPPEAQVDFATFKSAVHPDDREALAAAVRTAREGGQQFSIEYRSIGLQDGGRMRWLSERGRVVHDADGGWRVIGAVRDITAEKTGETVLREVNELLERRVDERTLALRREIKEREEIEAELRQAQKMEAIGQLTGGIAHDFNNILAGISGSLQLIRRLLDLNRVAEIGRFTDNALASVERAAALVHRMLAFSRRQALALTSVDVNALMLGLDDLLRRTVGESITIEMELMAGDCFARTDAPQLESALLNLAINARDAMPEGGRLRMSSARVHRDEQRAGRFETVRAGDYVQVTVADDGMGMAPSVVQRAFDPFFTTKPTGKGTGLGLSMVYGFAKQSGGFAAIDSTPGKGTTVCLFLPVDQAIQAPQRIAPESGLPQALGGETVLVVEDDASVRLLVTTVLQELRYTTIEVDHPDRAMEVIDGTGRIDLLVSDVGLPGMNGRQLAELARARRPGLPVLFMTGYAQNAGLVRENLEAGMDVIPKPFSLSALAERIRAMLAVQ